MGFGGSIIDTIAKQFFVGFYGSRMIELKALDMPGMQSPTEPHPQTPKRVFFMLGYILHFEQISVYDPPASDVLNLQVYAIIPSCRYILRIIR